ncbi:MAG: ribulose-phosphate 3-epimerase [Coriobacteriia bacterium]|nr:ribulose-phosphate 3-epimerase [Coriobacteriia bacterium]
MSDRVLMAPSVLSADFTQLGAAVDLMQGGGADFIHVDVMDGHFVPNLTIGPPVIKALKRVSKIPLDVHLMIDNADSTMGWYLDAGADWVTVHSEACRHIHRVVQTIHSAGAKAGVSLNPGTPVETLRDVIGELDMVLVMSVNPGFGGQSFIERAVDRVARLKRMCAEEGVTPLIQVDGGIDARTAPLVASAGARCLVAGSAIFCTSDPVAAMNTIREAAERAL